MNKDKLKKQERRRAEKKQRIKQTLLKKQSEKLRLRQKTDEGQTGGSEGKAAGTLVTHSCEKKRHDPAVFYIMALLIILAAVFAVCFLDIRDMAEDTSSTAFDADMLSSSESASYNGLERVTESERIVIPKSHVIKNFDIIYQYPELPTGCEITAMTMLMRYHGCDADKIVMAKKYLPIKPIKDDEDGKRRRIDFEQYFMGDPFSMNGSICGTTAVVTAANTYFREKGLKMSAVDISGASPERLYKFISDERPVFILCTINMEDRLKTESWNVGSRRIQWSSNDHGAVLVGYSDKYVTVADPISGMTEYSRKQFEKVYEQRGRRCVIINEHTIE